MIEVHTEVLDQTIRVHPPTVERFVRMVMAEHGVLEGNVTVIFGKDEMLRDLKSRFLGEDAFTDVIAFRLDQTPEGPVPGDDSFEGEIYISPQRASENADKYGIPIQNELSRLIFHGSLHLLGYEDDTPQHRTGMRRLEDGYLGRIKTEELSTP
ncbi:MAG: rRNA maturation RNase YbeY [Fidelibacterota bacterium]